MASILVKLQALFSALSTVYMAEWMRKTASTRQHEAPAQAVYSELLGYQGLGLVDSMGYSEFKITAEDGK